jgi:2-hydroxyglutarate dehydrogenase
LLIGEQVIHAGLYYGVEGLKTELCIRGREMMYALCKKYQIPHGNMGKWIVAQDEPQWEVCLFFCRRSIAHTFVNTATQELVKLHDHSRVINVPTEFVSMDKAKQLEPTVRATAGILSSPTTGIIDSHAYMQFLAGDFTETGGDIALFSTVTAIYPLPSGGFELTTVDTSGEEAKFSTEILINSAGLGACGINNMIMPEAKHVAPFYAKGNYFSYSGSHPKPTRLIYPAPVPGHGGLGTHLTLDLNGQIRFGPDVEWISDPSDLAVSTSPERFAAAVAEIKTYLPGVDESRIVPDYAGVRPKLGRASATSGGKGFMDFVIRRETEFGGSFVNLLGIESPGLTSSLAIAEKVEGLLYR